MPDPRSFDRVVRYLSLYPKKVKIKEFLGGGTDGEVFQSDRGTAVKVFHYTMGYVNERDTYHRLAEFGMTEKIGDFWVPRMVGWDDDLMVVEMDIMHHPPYVIDFAKVRIDRSPEFSEDVLREQEERGLNDFEHNWPAVKVLLADLESIQIHYLDPKRGNITFPDML